MATPDLCSLRYWKYSMAKSIHAVRIEVDLLRPYFRHICRITRCYNAQIVIQDVHRAVFLNSALTNFVASSELVPSVIIGSTMVFELPFNSRILVYSAAEIL